MARTRSFDKEEALAQALKAFWWDGYEKTSLEDLLKRMGIRTSSFYNTFVSKEALFFEALRHYRQNIGKERLDMLADENLSTREALEKYFEHLLRFHGHKDYPIGCFMMKTAATLTDTDSAIGREVMQAIANLEKGVIARLKIGQKQDEVSKKIDIEETARVFVAIAYGISVLGRTKKTKKELLSTANSFIGMLTSKS